jgi:hypothetical protein
VICPIDAGPYDTAGSVGPREEHGHGISRPASDYHRIACGDTHVRQVGKPGSSDVFGAERRAADQVLDVDRVEGAPTAQIDALHDCSIVVWLR